MLSCNGGLRQLCAPLRCDVMHSTHQCYVSLRMRSSERVCFMSSPSCACAKLVGEVEWVASSSLPVFFSALTLGGAMYHFAGMLVQCTPTVSGSESVQYKQNRSSLISTYICFYRRGGQTLQQVSFTVVPMLLSLFFFRSKPTCSCACYRAVVPCHPAMLSGNICLFVSFCRYFMLRVCPTPNWCIT